MWLGRPARDRKLDWSASVLACMFREDSNRDGCAPVDIKSENYQ
jgi:hypothetical protein